MEDVRKGGYFYLNIDYDNLRVLANRRSVFKILGNASRAGLSFTDENPRFEGASLSITSLEIIKVDANKMIVNSLKKRAGIIRVTGDVGALCRPAIVELEEFKIGH